jgi:glycosyltransferase involved in cell wall biosynthesis
MKILLYNNSHLPVVGGKEIVVHQLALGYQALGHEVVLSGPGGWWKHRHFHADYPIQRWPRAPGVAREAIWKAQFSWSAKRFGCDIVHAHTTYPNAFIAAKARGRHDYPIIVTPHGADIHKVPEINFGHRLDPVMDRKIRWALQQTDYATAISKSVVDSLRDAGLPPAKIVEIPNGVDVARFRRCVEFDVHKYLDIPRDSLLVVSVGNYHPRKGHELLISSVREAARVVPNLRLVIVGGRPDKLSQLVADEGIDHLIKFTGSLPYPVPGDKRPDILVALLKASSIYVSSSIGEGSEGLSLALLEAMSVGVCVVASDVSGNRDVIVENQNGRLVPSKSVEHLAAALVWLSRNDAERRRLGRAGQQCVEQHSWSAIAARYLSLFEHAIGARTGQPLTVGQQRWRS